MSYVHADRKNSAFRKKSNAFTSHGRMIDPKAVDLCNSNQGGGNNSKVARYFIYL
jgi:hypothetical protein